MCEEAATGVSIYTMISSWLTHSYLFIFINLVIGTIAITSRFANNHTKKQAQQLHRSPSLLNRVMSFNLSHYKHEPIVDPVQSHDSTRLDQVPSSSLLDTVMSSEDKDEKTENRVSSLSLLDKVMSSKGKSKDEKTETPEPDADEPTQQQQLTRAPSLLERLKSLTLFRSESVKEAEPEPESEVTGSAEKREEEEGVDAKADDFINKFRQQLRLQRLDSILRYRDMLK